MDINDAICLVEDLWDLQSDGESMGARELSNAGDCSTTKQEEVKRSHSARQQRRRGLRYKRLAIYGVLFASIGLRHSCRSAQQCLFCWLRCGKPNTRICVARKPVCSWTTETHLRIVALLCTEECSQSRTTNINTAESITFC